MNAHLRDVRGRTPPLTRPCSSRCCGAAPVLRTRHERLHGRSADRSGTQASHGLRQNGIVNRCWQQTSLTRMPRSPASSWPRLYRYAGKSRYGRHRARRSQALPDAGSVSAYATDALSWCVANGIVNGTLGGTPIWTRRLRHTRPGRRSCPAISNSRKHNRKITEAVQSGGLLRFFCCNALYRCRRWFHMKSRRLSLFSDVSEKSARSRSAVAMP